MKFPVRFASDARRKLEVEISSLEELLIFVKNEGSVILGRFGDPKIIYVYDDYIE